jgi:hypothetical protein
MKTLNSDKGAIARLVFFLLLAVVPLQLVNAQQPISFGIYADPVISWFTSDITQVKNGGARPGFNFGLTYNRYFAPNYAFSTGISLLSAGGKLVRSDTTIMNFSNLKATVMPGEPVTYRIQYLTFPLGLKLQSNQIGYVRFFTNLGLVPKIVVNRKIDIPSLSISGENGSGELRLFNLSYHVTAGLEYSLGGTTALVFGLDFDNNFMDITKDPGSRPGDRVSQKILSFRFGVNF